MTNDGKNVAACDKEDVVICAQENKGLIDDSVRHAIKSGEAVTGKDAFEVRSRACLKSAILCAECGVKQQYAGQGKKSMCKVHTARQQLSR